jgi:hypothetical protein
MWSLPVLAGLSSAVFAGHLDVTAVSSSSGGLSWQKTVDDSGMSGDTRTLSDLHDTDGANMGLSGSGAPHWVRYDLGEALPLDEMWIWNYNSDVPATTQPPWLVAHYAKGMKDIFIDASLNGSSYTNIFTGTLPVAQERGEAPGAVDLIVPFNQVVARFVRITTAGEFDHNYVEDEFGVGYFADSGLSEVRFYKATIAVTSQQVAASNVVQVVVPGDDGVRYNLECATSIHPPNWVETGIFVVGTGTTTTIYHTNTNDSATYYRGAAVGLEEVYGTPSPENDWSTESRVSIRASSFLSTGNPTNLINGSGITSSGVEHGVNAASMWLADDAVFPPGNPHGGTVAGGHWVEFKLIEVLPVSTMQIWNYANRLAQNWQLTGLGIKSATIQYTATGGGGPGGEWGSDNAGDWTTVWQGDLTPYAPPHPPSGVYLPSDEIDFGGTMVQYVVLTTSADPAEVNYASMIPLARELAGLSEVRFTSGVSYLLENPGDLLVDMTGTEFDSEAGQVYSLQRAPTGTQNYVNAGSFADGNGGEMVLFDPEGYSAANDYRIVIE